MAAAGRGRPGGVAELGRLLDAAGIGGRGRRSSLSRWMRTHHDGFAAMLADKRPGWDEVASALATMGLRDGQDRPPTAERARKAWWGVRQAVVADASGRATAPAYSSLASDEIAPAVRALPEPGPVGPEPQRPRLVPDLRPATPLGSSPPPPSATTAPSTTPGSREVVDGAAEALRRLRKQMGAAQVPLPKVVR
ncbi:hypothetical protein [Roseomonas mucosa]|uniref:hypothetical protein n=1 Tax=Roseomonas mucosa TaxID=207340 RepID=UPI0022458422|nr:hypothetical protein [Roseomonas mucosa]UZO94916.1 Hypothetical protein RMP42_05932 [Roseomonas mucosa]